MQMYCTRLLFTRRDLGESNDDAILITAHPDVPDIFEVLYRSPEVKMDRKFHASRSGVLDYIEDTLTSMRHDMDPFESIQVLTSIHPSVLYHVSDMDESVTRDLILKMIGDSLRRSVTCAPR